MPLFNPPSTIVGSLWIMTAGTANALQITDGTTSYWTTDTRITTNAVNAHTLGNANITLASASATSFHQVVNATFQLTLTGSTLVPNLLGMAFAIAVPTISSASANVTNASTMVIQGGPTISGGATINDSIALQLTGGGNIGIQLDTVFVANASNNMIGINVQTTYSASTGLLLNYISKTSFASGTYTAGHGGDFHAIQSTLPAGVTLNGVWVHVGNDTMTVNGTITDVAAGASHYALLGRGVTVGATGNVNTEAILGLTAPTNSAGGTLSTIYGILFETSSNPWNTLIGGVAPIVFQSNGGLHNFDPTIGVLTAGANVVWSGINIPAATFSVTGATGITNAVGVNLVTIRTPTINSATAGLTITNSATVMIQAAPIAGGANPPTLSNNWALRILAGGANISGAVTLAGGIFNVNVSSNFAVNIATGTTTGTVTIGNSAVGIITIANKANTAATFLITDGSTSYYALDTRTGVTATAHTFTTPVSTAGTPIGFKFQGAANTGLALAETIDFRIDLARTVNFAAGGGTIGTHRASVVLAPTYTATTDVITMTEAATFAINAAPTGGTNVSISNPYALWVQAGIARFAGGINASGTNTLAGGTLNVMVSSNFAVNIATGTTTGAVTIGNSAAGLITIANKPAIAATFKITDSTNNYYAIDTRTAVTATAHTFTATASTAGSPTTFNVTGPVHTTLTIAETTDVNYALNRTVTFTSGGGTIATQRAFLIQAPTYQATTNAVTLTMNATLTVAAAPTSAGVLILQGGITAAIAVDTTGATIGNTAATTYQAISVAPHTITLSQTTQITAAVGASALTLGVVTINQSGGAVTVNNASTLNIVGPPVAGASVTVTRLYAMFAQAGTSRFDGSILSQGATAATSGGVATPILLAGTAPGLIGVYFGSAAPTISAGQGSLYLRTDGSSGTTRAYINTTGSTTWTAMNTVA